ncbi:MAG TPA: hypothetical protein VKV33_04160 [Streptosporangiaceae bacterium]|nr:hypothetical protein [Streptosporangiaceae bacterium]
MSPVPETPRDLAVASFGDGRYASVAGEARSGDWAVVLALTNEEPYLVPYEMVFRRDEGGWAEVAGNDSPGWRATGDAQGFVTVWGEAPGGATRVTVRFRDAGQTVPVSAGHFLAVFWDVPETDFDGDVPAEVSPAG